MDKGTITRTVILVVALVNQLLVAFGKSPIPVSDEEIELLISSVFTVVVAIWTWWKNNYVSGKGKAQKETLEKNGLA